MICFGMSAWLFAKPVPTVRTTPPVADAQPRGLFNLRMCYFGTVAYLRDAGLVCRLADETGSARLA